MTMLRLLHISGVKTVAAHCNFGLRGSESDADEAFVKNETEKLEIQLHVSHFDTSAYAAQNDLSIQMAARELRYRWFHELVGQHALDAVAIAHNRDDRTETLFINLARGTGIHGLSGIKPKNGKIIRPLLFASREEIEAYAQTHGIAFREDSSNTTDKYVRNYIRRHVLPGLEQYFPGLRQTIDRNMEHFSSVESFYNEAIERYKSKIITTKDDLTYIDLQGLSKSPSPPTLLYEILKPAGFSNHVAAEILEETRHPSGRQFFSDTHRLLHDRQSLVLQKSETEQPQEYFIYGYTSDIDIPVRLKIEKFAKYQDFIPDANPDVACLDGQKLQFPLTLRRWKYGD
jgi:tRNA(Ile)-lysidine synthase